MSDLIGPVEKIDPLRDMVRMRMGELNSDHRGLHVQLAIPGQGTCYGRITHIEHGDLTTKVGVRWNGAGTERRGDPDQIIRIEAHQ